MLKDVISSKDVTPENDTTLNKEGSFSLSGESLNNATAKLIIQCQFCQTEYESPYTPGQIVKFIEEFNEYENFRTDPCPECGAIEIFNMNLPPEECTEEFFEEVNIHESERLQRRKFMIFRNDLVFERKESTGNDSTPNKY